MKQQLADRDAQLVDKDAQLVVKDAELAELKSIVEASGNIQQSQIPSLVSSENNSMIFPEEPRYSFHPGMQSTMSENTAVNNYWAEASSAHEGQREYISSDMNNLAYEAAALEGSSLYL